MQRGIGLGVGHTGPGDVADNVLVAGVRATLRLLLLLGLLFALPIAAKTVSAHGWFAGLATGAGVVTAVLLGPLAFLLASAMNLDVFVTVPTVTGVGTLTALVLGAVFAALWLRRLQAGQRAGLPYLPVAGWALLGVAFCVWQVFAHIV